MLCALILFNRNVDVYRDCFFCVHHQRRRRHRHLFTDVGSSLLVDFRGNKFLQCNNIHAHYVVFMLFIQSQYTILHVRFLPYPAFSRTHTFSGMFKA